MKKFLKIQIADSLLHALSVTYYSNKMKAPCSRLKTICLLQKIYVCLLVCLLAYFSTRMPTDSENTTLN